jgi:hypothetical protein
MTKDYIGVANLVIVSALIWALSGCQTGGSQNAQPAKLRVIAGGWAVIGPLNVTIDGNTVATGIMYPSCVNEVCQTLSTYFTVKSGSVKLAVQNQGSSVNVVPQQFQTLSLAANTQNTFVLGGSTQIAGFLFVDDDIPAANSVKIRIANADPTTGSPGAWVLPQGMTPSGNPTISGVAPGSASSYLVVAPGDYVETFAISCFIAPNCISVGPTTFSANQNVTVYILNEGLSHRPLILADN